MSLAQMNSLGFDTEVMQLLDKHFDPDAQHMRVQEWNRQHDWRLPKNSPHHPRRASLEVNNDGVLEVDVLVPYRGTFPRTLESLWEVASDFAEAKEISRFCGEDIMHPVVKGDSMRMAVNGIFLREGCLHPKAGLVWQRLRFGSEWRMDSGEQEKLPMSATFGDATILAFFCHCQELFPLMDDRRFPSQLAMNAYCVNHGVGRSDEKKVLFFGRTIGSGQEEMYLLSDGEMPVHGRVFPMLLS